MLGNEERFSVNHPEALDSLSVGNTILLENGLMSMEVISKENDGVTCRIVNGGVLGNKKSLSVPGVHINMPYISEQDRKDIIYACEHEGDILAISFRVLQRRCPCRKRDLKRTWKRGNANYL